ncbi:hypothetical protein F4V57_12600 [Acinetobacter qingfengensis]|uniref:Chemotaxis protein n=1 Tax=Acinetobacter qingfengensis TaxID=1262585 RepID=A0A1E7R831_9GAMM|nr:hypothetical protein [Acinetobacter qingfengensis]KAA8731420.1 hypothetical protein F4V57_12600 [Acinetobacter qingfengensis]OEY95519.1 hypothetical protein BJI46_12855 [Acinetobacter qingfengensis]
MSFQSSSHFDSTPLLIVKTEIENIIKNVETGVNQLLEDQIMPFGIEDALINLQQAAQVLALIEQPYLAKLTQLTADVMYKVLQDFKQQNIHANDIQAMSEGMNTLVHYIDFLCIKEASAPQLLISAINQLEISLKKPLTHEGTVVQPFLEAIEPNIKLDNPAQLPESQLVLRLYKVSLLHLLKNKTSLLDYQALSLCGNYFSLKAEGLQSQQFWRLVHQALKNSAQIHLTEPRLRSLIQIEQLAEQFFAKPSLFEVKIQNLADVIILCLSEDSLVAAQIREQLNLMDDVLSDNQLQCLRRQLFGPDFNTISTVVHLLNEQITTIEKQIEFGDYLTDNSQQLKISEQLSEMAKVFSIINLEQAAIQLQQQATKIRSIQYLADPAHANELMNALLFSSNALQMLAYEYTPVRAKLPINNHHIILETVENAQQTLCQEARLSVQKLSDMLIRYAQNMQHTELEEIPALLREVSGGLLFLESEQGYQMLQKTAQLLEQYILATKRDLQSREIRLLANTIASADYHFEQIQNHHPFMPKTMQVGLDSVAQLQQAMC